MDSSCIRIPVTSFLFIHCALGSLCGEMSEKVILSLYEWWIDGQTDGQHETELEPRAGAK